MTSSAAPPSERIARILEATASGPLPAFLRTRRWFSTDGRAVERVVLRDHAVIEPASATRPAYVVALFDVSRAESAEEGAAIETYAIPLVVGTGGAGTPDGVLSEIEIDGVSITIADALSDPRYARAMLAAIARASTFPTARGGMLVATRGAPMLGHIGGGAIEALPVRALRSHTDAVVFSRGGQDRVVMRSMRRLGGGTAIEVELAAALTRAGFASVPQLLGDVAYLLPQGSTGGPITLVVAQQFLPHVSDGLQHALSDLSSSLGRPRSSAPSSRPWSNDSYARSVRQLGEVTAAMHLALISDRHDPTFAPEPFTTADRDALVDAAIDRLHRAIEALRVGTLASEVGDVAGEVVARGAAIEARLRETALPGGALKARVHGDYQLRQVLRLDRDERASSPRGATSEDAPAWAIADFDGDAASSPEGRRAKRPPLRDVASMLRSFDYVAFFGARDAIAAQPAATPERRVEIETLAASWREAARGSFLAGYAASSSASILPRDGAVRDGFLALHEIDAGLHELLFELQHRPECAVIALRALLRASAPRA